MDRVCCFFALEFPAIACLPWIINSWEACMKKLAVAVALVVTALSLGGCFVGKGKGKAPAPVVTKG